ncbi:DUF4238 domain-containing protein [Actinomadura geliboluensis]|uniref:DUF4238 domain-containing protein n=1 Tax=Actinomadura geliboluensis TaxID=882440 RepID=UPI00371B1F4F
MGNAGNEFHVKEQHIVSRTLLKQFAKKGPKGWTLVSFNLERPNHKHRERSIRACGKTESFVRHESASIEKLWNDLVEQKAAAAISAAQGARAVPPESVIKSLKDLITLHLVRSHWYQNVHDNSFITSFDRLGSRLLLEKGEEIKRRALFATGLHLETANALRFYIDRFMRESEPAQDYASGKLFRTSIEDTFFKMRDLVSSWGVEILRPEAGRFIIGDSPAMTICLDGQRIKSYKMAVGEANSVLLPIGPTCLLALGSNTVLGSIPETWVDQANELQIRAARKYVYLHPDSRAENFVRATLRVTPTMADSSSVRQKLATQRPGGLHRHR